MNKIISNHPFIPVVDNETREIHYVQYCAFVFCDPLTDTQIAMIEKNTDLIFKKVDRGFFIAHFLDQTDWAKKMNIYISYVYPPFPHEYPEELNPKHVIIH